MDEVKSELKKEALENWKALLAQVSECLNDPTDQPQPLVHLECIEDLESLVANMKEFYKQIGEL